MQIGRSARHWPDAPAADLQLSQAYADQATRARELGWPVTEQVSHHLAPLTDAVTVAESLGQLVPALLRTQFLPAALTRRHPVRRIPVRADLPDPALSVLPPHRLHDSS